jgi:hypothetical protein
MGQGIPELPNGRNFEPVGVVEIALGKGDIAAGHLQSHLPGAVVMTGNLATLPNEYPAVRRQTSLAGLQQISHFMRASCKTIKMPSLRRRPESRSP